MSIELDESDGSFVAHGPGGPFTLLARGDGLLPERIDTLSLGAGEEVEEVTLVLRHGLTVAGRVLGEQGPLTGAHVVVEAAGYLRSVYSNDDGSFEVTGLPEGTVSLRGFDDSEGTDAVETRSGDWGVLLRLRREGHLRGRVLDAHQAPVAGAMIFLDEADPQAEVAERDPFGSLPSCLLGGSISLHMCGPMPQCLSRAETDSSGEFEVVVATGARIVVGASFDGASGSVTTSGTTEGVTLVLTRKTFRLRASRSQGHPYVGDLTVSTELQGLQVVDQTLTTSSEGTAEADLWPGVPVRLRAPPGVQIDFPDGTPSEVRVEEEDPTLME